MQAGPILLYTQRSQVSPFVRKYVALDIYVFASSASAGDRLYSTIGCFFASKYTIIECR